jgi:hypothetical protein
MKVRLRLALLVLLGGLTAFAPAPLPRPRREPPPECSLAALRGTWRLAGTWVTRADGRHEPTEWPVTHVLVKGDRWYFVNGKTGIDNEFLLDVEADKAPAAHLTLHNKTGRWRGNVGVGLIRRKGAGFEVIYRFGGGEDDRPSFDPPTEGCWLMTLQPE